MEAYKQPKQEPPKIRRYKTIYMRPGDAEAYEVLLANLVIQVKVIVIQQITEKTNLYFGVK